MTAGARVVLAARALVGTRFRPHGRDPALGLDCVGLAALAFRAGGFEGAIPSGYALRGGHPERVAARIDATSLRRCDDRRPGDLLLCASGPGQLHLAIASADGVIHADATLRRVVERPGALPWPVLGRWRIDDERGN
jgi:cell wall-associated NlpC family hydrolase